VDTKTSVVLVNSLERISRSIKLSMEELETVIDDPVIEDYYNNLKEVEAELDGTLYAIEQALTAADLESYH
jgi:predicted nucleotide-binding protein